MGEGALSGSCINRKRDVFSCGVRDKKRNSSFNIRGCYNDI